MENKKITQILVSPNGYMYGLDEEGNVWFAFKKEGEPNRWNMYIPHDLRREPERA